MADKAKVRVRGYIRISEKDSRANEAVSSLKTQRSRIVEYFNANYPNNHLDKVYDKDAGKTAFLKDEFIKVDYLGMQLISTFDLRKRPGLAEVLADAKKGEFDVLLINRWDRFHRSFVLQYLVLLYLERFGVQVVPTDDSKDRLVRQISAVLSEEEPRGLVSE